MATRLHFYRDNDALAHLQESCPYAWCNLWKSLLFIQPCVLITASLPAGSNLHIVAKLLSEVLESPHLQKLVRKNSIALSIIFHNMLRFELSPATAAQHTEVSALLMLVWEKQDLLQHLEGLVWSPPGSREENRVAA